MLLQLELLWFQFLGLYFDHMDMSKEYGTLQLTFLYLN